MRKRIFSMLQVGMAMLSFFFLGWGEWSSCKTVAAEVDLTVDMSEELEAEIRANIPNVVFRPDASKLTNSKTPNDAQILSNTLAIQAALDACAEAGGGIVELPEGYYRVTTQNRNAAGNVVKAGLFIKSGKTWLRGAGKDKTTIETESKFRLYKTIDGVRTDVTDDIVGTGDCNDPSTFNGKISVYVDGNGNPVFDYWDGRRRERATGANRTQSTINGINRGDGLRLFEPSGPLTDIMISDFDLFGGLKGHNGDYDWWIPAHEINGWDMSHKGINFGHGSFRDRVLMQNMIVREYRGEMLYSGGAHSETSGLQRIVIDNCTVKGSNASNINVMGKVTIKNSTFGDARFFAETVAEFPNSYMHIFNNRFYNSHSGQGYWVTESPGTPKVHANCHVLIYNNVFDNTEINAGGSFALSVENNSWNTIIRNNKIYNFHVALWTRSGHVKKGSHIIFENNDIYATTRNTDMVLTYNGVDVQLLNNRGHAANGNRVRLVNANLIGPWGYKGIGGPGADINGWHNSNVHSSYIVKGNRPGNSDPGSLMPNGREAHQNNNNDRPMYVDNVYSQNPSWGVNPDSVYEPNAEYLNLTGGGTVRLFDQLYQNGQPLRITGGDGAVFQTGTAELNTGLVMKQPRTLTGKQTLNLEYRLATQKWHETEFHLNDYFGDIGMTFERMNTTKGILDWSDLKADSPAGFTLKKNGAVVTKLPGSATSYHIKDAIAGGGELWELFLGETMIAAVTVWMNDGTEQTVLYREGGTNMWFERAGNRGTLTWVRFSEQTTPRLTLKRNGAEVTTLDGNVNMYGLTADISADGDLWEIFAGTATQAAASISITPVQSMTFARTGATSGTLTWTGLTSPEGFVLKKDNVTVAEISPSVQSHHIAVSSNLPGEIWELFAGDGDTPRLLASATIRVSEAPQFSVIYDAGGGKGTVPVDTNLYSKGDAVYIKAKGNLTREGYEFLCWNVKPDFTRFPDWFVISNEGKTGIPDYTRYPDWFGFSYAENSKMIMGSLSMPQMGNVTLYAQWIRSGSLANRNIEVAGDKDTKNP